MPRSVRTAHVFEKKWRSDDVRLQEEATFSSFILPDKILIGLENSGYKTPSPIQLEAIPVGLIGRDLLVQAKSGTGKTLVFTVIALESLSEIKYPQVLIMAPTREIALQICDVVRAVGSSFKGLTCNCFIGGIAFDNDVEKVHGCQIVVGTPGRLKHLISLGILPTNSIRLLVLDEADVLLESNFKDDLDYIFVSLPKEKQVIATSATYPRHLRSLTRQYFREVHLARLNSNELTLLGMVHYIQVLESSKMSLLAYKAKLAALERVVTSLQFTQCLVFCNLISRVESLCYDIRNWGFTSTFISSAKEQFDRIKAIECLKRFKCKILVTSDVSSRGIDAENVDLVVNFDKPLNTEVYFHRCGRAGRYGAKGVAITFLEKDEVAGFEQMKLKHNLKAYNLPDPIPPNLINIRPREYISSTEDSEDDLSDDVSNKKSNDSNDKCNGKVMKRDNNADPSSLCNGKSSSNLNGHSTENGFVEESAISDENIDCKLDANIDNIDTVHDTEHCKLDTTNNKLNSERTPEINENRKESLDFKNNSEKTTESEICHAGTENGKENASSEINGDIASIENRLNEKNSFLEYLQSGPKEAESSSHCTLVSDSAVIVNSNASTESVLSNELKISATSSETKEPVNQKGISKSESVNVMNKECNESTEKLVSPPDSQDTLTLEKNITVSTNTSLPIMQDPPPSSNETKDKFVPSKIQLSVGKYLIEHANESNVNNLESLSPSKLKGLDRTSNNDLCVNKTDTEQDIKALKDIRDDLTDFYSKVYKAYQAENISNTDFESIKAVLIREKEEEIKKSSKRNVPNKAELSTCNLENSDGKVTSENIPNGLNKENAKNSFDIKVCDIVYNNSSHSVVSNESISSEKSNAVEESQVLERYVFKDNSSDSSLNSSDSSSNEDSYLALKDTFNNMKTTKRANTKTNLHASQKREKEKCINMKKKFSANADKRHHSSPYYSRKLSSSDSSSVSDPNNKFQEFGGAKKKTNDKHASNLQTHNAKSRNKKAKSHTISAYKKYNSISVASNEDKLVRSATNNENILINNHDTASSLKHSTIPSTNQLPDQTTNVLDYRNISCMNQPHQYTTSAMNYENDLPSSPYIHHNHCNDQTYEYTPINYMPNQVNVYDASHSQLGHVCCHDCSNTWYQIYQKQWQFIHSSLF